MPSQYATAADFDVFARPLSALAGTVFDTTTDTSKLDRVLEAQSRMLDRDLGLRQSVPLPTPLPADQLDVVQDVCTLAEYQVVSAIGYRNDDEAERLRERYLDVVKRHPGLAEPDQIPDDATPFVQEGGPRVHSRPLRGW